MNRPKPKLKYLLAKIINEEINKMYIDEILDSINTDYKIFINKKTSQNYIHDTYRFKTKNNNSYDVEFYKNKFYSGFIELLNDVNLSDVIGNDVTTEIVIGFTPTEIAKTNIPIDLMGTENDPYVTRTNRNEQYEVLGKIIFLVQEYIKNNPEYYIYDILKASDKKNIIVYNSIFKNLFSKDFTMFESDESFFYIKNNQIKS